MLALDHRQHRRAKNINVGIGVVWAAGVNRLGETRGLLRRQHQRQTLWSLQHSVEARGPDRLEIWLVKFCARHLVGVCAAWCFRLRHANASGEA